MGKSIQSDIKDDQSTTSLLSDSDDDSIPRFQRRSPHRSNARWIAILSAAVLISNALTFVVTYFSSSSHRSSFSLAEPPNGAPNIFRGLSLQPQPTLVNATFYDAEDSIYRKHASAEADRAWKELTQSDHGVFLVPKEDAEQSDIDLKKHAYWDEPEKGLVGYPVGVEALHQLHCLNLLRKNLYFNFEFTKKQASKACPGEQTPHCGIPKEYYELHIDHCVDLLRRRLMCTADVGIIPLIWLGENGRTTGDMNRMHTCRNYENIRQFTMKNAVSMPKAGTVKPKAGDYKVDDYI